MGEGGWCGHSDFDRLGMSSVADSLTMCWWSEKLEHPCGSAGAAAATGISNWSTTSRFIATWKGLATLSALC